MTEFLVRLKQRKLVQWSLAYDPMLLRYQRDPRFAVYCRKVGLPAPTASESPGTANSSSPDS